MPESEVGLGQVVRAAMGGRDASALEPMLRALAEVCGAFGAVLWKVRVDSALPDADGSNQNSRAATEADLANLPAEQIRQFVVAHGFSDRALIYVHHDLPLSRVSGQAVLRGEFEIPDIASCPSHLIDRKTSLYQKAKPSALYSVRIEFEDRTLGALTIYGRRINGFTGEEKLRFKTIATRYVPQLYASILDRGNYRLLEETSACLEHEGEPRDSLQEIAEIGAKSLSCEDMSIFLEDRLTAPGRFSLVATTCKELIRGE